MSAFSDRDYWATAVRQRTAIVPRLVTEPASEPVTLVEAKAQCRVDTSTDDTYIASLIKGARLLCEAKLNRSFITTTWSVTFDAFPCGNEAIDLPRPRLIAVSSVVYTDTNQQSQTWAGSNYTVDTKSEPGRIMPAYTGIWPAALSHINTVTVTYTAGYGADATFVPQSIKQAILLIVGHWYANREQVLVGAISKEIEVSVDALLGTERWTPL